MLYTSEEGQHSPVEVGAEEEQHWPMGSLRVVHTAVLCLGCSLLGSFMRFTMSSRLACSLGKVPAA